MRGNQNLPCPECSKICTSTSGLSLHMNAVHLVLSPSQGQARDKTLGRATDPTKPVCSWCGDTGRRTFEQGKREWVRPCPCPKGTGVEPTKCQSCGRPETNHDFASAELDNILARLEADILVAETKWRNNPAEYSINWLHDVALHEAHGKALAAIQAHAARQVEASVKKALDSACLMGFGDYESRHPEWSDKRLQDGATGYQECYADFQRHFRAVRGRLFPDTEQEKTS